MNLALVHTIRLQSTRSAHYFLFTSLCVIATVPLTKICVWCSDFVLSLFFFFFAENFVLRFTRHKVIFLVSYWFCVTSDEYVSVNWQNSVFCSDKTWVLFWQNVNTYFSDKIKPLVLAKSEDEHKKQYVCYIHRFVQENMKSAEHICFLFSKFV